MKEVHLANAFIVLFASSLTQAYLLTGTPCNNLPPGLAVQSLGIDVRKFDPTPWADPKTDNQTDPVLGYKNVLFDFTCDQNLTFVDALDNNTVYQLPDQVADMYITSRGYVEAKYNDFESAESMREWSGDTFGLSVDFKKYAFSGSISHTYALEQENDLKRSLSTCYALQSGVVSQLQPSFFIQFGRAAQYLVSLLPEKFDDNPTAYCLFVDTYGTHYMEQIELGGIFRTVSSVDMSFKAESKSSSIAWDVGATFDYLVHVNGGHAQNDTHASSQFVEHSTTIFDFYGGLKTEMNSTGFDGWWSTVHKLPYVIAAQLKPISDILKLSSPAKADSLMKAQLLYTNDGCVKYLQQTK